ncbi:MAG: hypothetical protein FWB93_05440 [Oscillospiraceae bacterium]|nr:hypothetical protein [Oscillospiraceae bacterium]
MNKTTKIRTFLENAKTWRIYRRTLAILGCCALLFIVAFAAYAAISGGLALLLDWVVVG